MHTGQCECGAVRFHFDHQISGFLACHCTQCRRISGMYWAGFDVAADKLIFDADEGLRWYSSSAWARRGFCAHCGSSLFYRLHEEGASYAVAPGAIDGPLGRQIAGHIFAADKGDYYEITDRLPQHKAAP